MSSFWLDKAYYSEKHGFLALLMTPMDEGAGAGAEINSNFHQLLLLQSNDDPSIHEFLKQKSKKYTDHHIQDELLKILALNHLRSIAADINKSGYFTLQADEMTDSSNKDQVIVCLHLMFMKTS